MIISKNTTIFNIMMKPLLIFLFSFCPLLISAQTLDSLLNALDKTIEQSEFYEKEKLKRIERIKKDLQKPRLSIHEEYLLNRQLYDEYESLVYDSARYYINRNIEIAHQLNNQEWLDESKLKKAHILATSGLYVEGIELLKSINKATLTHHLLAEYYITFENIYLYRSEYTQDDEYMPQYLQLMNSYRDTILQIVPEGSYAYIITKGPVLVDHQQLAEAKKLLRDYCTQVDNETREYAVITSILAFINQYDNQIEERKENLARSAIADIKAVVKENNSLRALAEILYEEGAVGRANKYMKKSMTDASFYNARLRNVQASKMLPVIDEAYQTEKEAQRSKLQIFLAVISVLTVFLFIAIAYVVMQMRKLTKARQEVIKANRTLQELNTELMGANQKQQETNRLMMEANCIKEEYLGRFLGLCSVYIDKLETYRRMLNKLAAAGKLDELYKKLKSSEFTEKELKEFYQNFDSSFLSIFPDFVERFNNLLPIEEQILPKQGEHLTTELRIFALIRLGISDSARIAGFLRYSISTIYTYRSKLKNKSLYKDDFEEQVMKIGSF